MSGDARPELGSVDDILHEFLSGASVRPGAPFGNPHAQLSKDTKITERKLRRAAFRLNPSKVPMTAGRVWAFSTTHNQAETIDPVAAIMNAGAQPALDHALLIDPMSGWGGSLARAALRRLPDATAQLSALCDDDLSRVADLTKLLATTFGEADCFRRMAARKRPSAVLITNDHSPRNRAIFAAAQDMGIPTAYLQHAAVGGIERALTMDLALLQGRHSLEIYRSIGPVEARIELIGAPKIDVARRARIPQSTDKTRLIIFPGLFDDFNRVEQIARSLRSAFPKAVIQLRRHPRDYRDQWVRWPQDVAQLLKHGQQTTMETLITCDLAVVDDSNVGLEAAALGVPVLCAPFKDEQSDQYGLAGTGIFEACKTDGTDVADVARAVLAGQAGPDETVLNYVFEGLSSRPPQADHRAARAMLALAGLG